MSKSGREVLPDVQEWSGGPPGCLGMVRRPSEMSGSCRDAVTDVRESLPVVREWLGDHPSCLGVVGVHPGCPGVSERPSRMSGSGREALLEVWEGLPDVRELAETLLNVREWF